LPHHINLKCPELQYDAQVVSVTVRSALSGNIVLGPKQLAEQTTVGQLLQDDGAEVCDWLAHPEAGVVFLETRFLQRDGHQLAAGLHYCHVNHVIHRDIKPHNILVHLDTTTLKLADFGLARPSSHFRPLTPEVISLWYRPPELLMRSKDYDVSVDIWSFGCILSEMATGKAWPGISSLPFYAEIFPHRRVWLSKSSWPRRPTTSRTFSRRQL